MKIGIFDSGIGGLSLLNEALQRLPRAEFIYYADVDHVPYGEKSPEEILEFSEKAMDFLIKEGARAVVIACNTATSVAVKDLREKYEAEPYSLPIIGMEPAVKLALDSFENGRILAAATPVTVKGKKLFQLIEKYDKERRTDTLPLPGLVRLAEEGLFGTEEADDYIKGVLSNYDLSEYSALVLGCTHFNYFKDSFRRILPPSVRIIDGVDGTVRRLISRLQGEETNGLGGVEFYESGRKVENKERFLSLLRILSEMEKIV